MNYTPGPWTETDDVFFLDKEKNEPTYRQITAGDGYYEKGKGFGLTGYISPEDARLIASSPELYESLKALIAASEMHGCAGIEFFEARNSALEVLSRLRGVSA